MNLKLIFIFLVFLQISRFCYSQDTIGNLKDSLKSKMKQELIDEKYCKYPNKMRSQKLEDVCPIHNKKMYLNPSFDSKKSLECPESSRNKNSLFAKQFKSRIYCKKCSKVYKK